MQFNIPQDKFCTIFHFKFKDLNETLFLLQEQHGYIDFNYMKENWNKTHVEKWTINKKNAQIK